MMIPYSKYSKLRENNIHIRKYRCFICNSKYSELFQCIYCDAIMCGRHAYGKFTKPYCEICRDKRNGNT